MNFRYTLCISLSLVVGGTLTAQTREIDPLQRILIRDSPRLEAIYCCPSGTGPFPLVIYNHGGLGQAVGGPIEDTCRALARAGFVGYAPIRRKTISMNGHLNDVLEGLRHASKLKKVDATKTGMIGFSRGGLLTYLATIRNPDMRAAIILAPAHGRGALEASLQHSNRIRCPILILISENDNTKFDLVSLSSRLEQALKSADKTVQRIVYPPFENDGHRRFFTIGSYWNDVESFLRQHLSTPPGRND